MKNRCRLVKVNWISVDKVDLELNYEEEDLLLEGRGLDKHMYSTNE